MGLKDYIIIIKKRIWIIIIIILLFIGGSVIIDNFLIEEIYEANATVYVGKKTEQQTGIMYDDLLINQFLVKDYKEIMKSRSVSQKVVDELKKENKLESSFNPLTLNKKIEISLLNDTRVIEIKVRDTIPQRAENLANEYAEVFKIKILELMKVDNIKIIDWAQLPDKPAIPKKERDIVLAGFIGFLFGMCLVFFLEYLDNTIKSSEDVKKYLELPVLGIIPDSRTRYYAGGKK